MMERVALTYQFRVRQTLNLSQSLFNSCKIAVARRVEVANDLRQSQRELALLTRFTLGDDLADRSQEFRVSHASWPCGRWIVHRRCPEGSVSLLELLQPLIERP